MQVTIMKDDIAERAQLIINDVFPTKILQLNQLFQVIYYEVESLHAYNVVHCFA